MPVLRARAPAQTRRSRKVHGLRVTKLTLGSSAHKECHKEASRQAKAALLVDAHLRAKFVLAGEMQVLQGIMREHQATSTQLMRLEEELSCSGRWGVFKS